MSRWQTSRIELRAFDSGPRGYESQVSAWLLKTVDWGLGAIIFIAPHLFGGRHPLGRFLIVALCAITAIAWFARQWLLPKAQWIRSSVWIIPLSAMLVVVFQLVPLPATWFTTFSPRWQDLLPLCLASGSPDAPLGTWQTLSLAPEESRLALATLVAYGLLFVTAVQRLRTVEDISHLMRMIGYSAAIVAGFGVLQYCTSNGKFFWFYDYPFTNTDNGLKAGFTCRNHFAHFLVLGLAMLLSLVMLERVGEKDRSNSRKRYRQKRQNWDSSQGTTALSAWLLTALAFLIACTIIATLSRGGAIALATAVVVAAGIYSRLGLLKSNHLLVGGLLMVLTMAVLSLSGNYSDVSNRLDDIVSKDFGEIDSVASRKTIWAANLASIRDGWLTGSGAGSHRFVYPIYLTEPSDLEYTHAENGYLQIATENGLPGILLLSATLLVCGYWVVSIIRNSTGNHQALILAGGIAAALSASVVHSIVDFVWFIPACACVTILLIAALLRLYQLSLPAEKKHASYSELTPGTWLNIKLGVALAGIWAVVTMLVPARASLDWDAYLRASLANQRAAERIMLAPEHQLDGLLESQKINGNSMVEHLKRILEVYPESARAQARLAGVLLSSFEDHQRDSENAMPISQIREAALASNFTSAAHLRDWLLKAFGEQSMLLYQAHFHARQALKLCPLQGEALLCLAELSFLEGSASPGYGAYAQQALRVRPCDSELLFAIGKQELITGRHGDAIGKWQKAFHGSGKHRDYIARLSADWMNAATFLETYQPDWKSMRTVWHVYREVGTPEDLDVLLQYAAQRVATLGTDIAPNVAANAWLSLSMLQQEIAGPQVALASLQQAFLLDPNSFSIRYETGKCLLACKKFTPAQSHLRWCFDHQPENATVRHYLQLATRGTLEQLARTRQTSLK